MYTGYRCCCQNNTNNMSDDMIETICDNVPSSTQCPCGKNACSCGFDDESDMFPSNPMFGQSYVPIQHMDKTFVPCTGLQNGTLFPELVSPYSPCQSIEENAFIQATNTIGEGCNR